VMGNGKIVCSTHYASAVSMHVDLLAVYDAQPISTGCQFATPHRGRTFRREFDPFRLIPAALAQHGHHPPPINPRLTQIFKRCHSREGDAAQATGRADDHHF